MELKLRNLTNNLRCTDLLIVPYGIETIYKDQKYAFLKLLIVPYGIETL